MQATSSEGRVPSARTSPVRAEIREPSSPLAVASSVIELEPPEGITGGEQREQDTHMQDPSAPTEEKLGASQIGVEQSHDKSSLDTEQPEP